MAYELAQLVLSIVIRFVTCMAVLSGCGIYIYNVFSNTFVNWRETFIPVSLYCRLETKLGYRKYSCLRRWFHRQSEDLELNYIYCSYLYLRKHTMSDCNPIYRYVIHEVLLELFHLLGGDRSRDYIKAVGNLIECYEKAASDINAPINLQSTLRMMNQMAKVLINPHKGDVWTKFATDVSKEVSDIGFDVGADTLLPLRIRDIPPRKRDKDVSRKHHVSKALGARDGTDNGAPGDTHDTHKSALGDRDDSARHDVALGDRYDPESVAGTTDGASASSDPICFVNSPPPGASFSSGQLDRSSTSSDIDSDAAGHIKYR